MANTPTIEQNADTAPYWTVQQAAEYFNININTAYVRARTDWRQFRVKIGENVRLNSADLIKWAQQRQGR